MPCGTVEAAGARFSLELESEKDRDSTIINNAVTSIPGWDFGDGHLFSRVEVLLEANQDNQCDPSGRGTANKLFLRLCHDGELGGSLAYYGRGGIRRAFNISHDYNYGYIEPGVEHKFTTLWAWSGAGRAIDAIDNTDGQRVSKVITGPSYDMDEDHERVRAGNAPIFKQCEPML